MNRPHLEWATPARYNNPHSIAIHQKSGLLLVADREDLHVKLLQSSDGHDLGAWDCGLEFGAKGRPFGVRTLRIDGYDLTFVAIMDNPQASTPISLCVGLSTPAALAGRQECQNRCH